MKTSQRGFIGIILIVAIAVAAIGGGTYVYTKKKDNANPITATSQASNVSTTAKVDGKTSTGTDEINETATGIVTTTKVTENHSPSFSSKAEMAATEDCGYETCFQQKFKSCESAVTTADIGIGAVEYKIMGKGATGCNLSFKYTDYPDAAWIDKEMTCEFNNKVSFDDSMQAVFSGVTTGAVVCRGPLYEILRPR